MDERVQNQIEFTHPLLFSIALSLMAGCDTNGNEIPVDFNTIAPIPSSVLKAFSGIHTQRLVMWCVTENATDVEIDEKKLIIRFKTLQNHPKGVVQSLYDRLPGGWTWKFASKIHGFDIGYYVAKGVEREFVDLSNDSEYVITQFTQELWNLSEREGEIS